MSSIIADLDSVEIDILRVMEIAKQTSELLQIGASRDQNAIRLLSTEYAYLVDKIQNNFKNCSKELQCNGVQIGNNSADYTKLLLEFLEKHKS